MPWLRARATAAGLADGVSRKTGEPEPDEEAIRIGGVEAVGVPEAGVPPFGRRPVDGQVELGAGHGADLILGGTWGAHPA